MQSTSDLRSLQHKIHMYRIKWKDDFPIIGFIQQSGIQQNMNISMYNLTVIAVAATPDDERNCGLEGGRLRSRNILAARPRNLT
jgi:hypothetical protein